MYYSVLKDADLSIPALQLVFVRSHNPALVTPPSIAEQVYYYTSCLDPEL